MNFLCKDELYSKGIFIFLIFIILSVFFSNCEDEKPEPREYPRVNTFPVINITENGATFQGEIYSEGTEPVTEHGFVWNAFYNPIYGTSNKVIIGPAKWAGEFSADVLTTLIEGNKYKVRAFAKTDEHIVYGPEVTFVSLGSGAPKITGFEPSSGRWGDTITIKGENFSYIPENNIVLFNYIQCPVVKSTDSTLSVLVSPQLTAEENKISVGIEGNFSKMESQEFTLILPSFSDISPTSAFWGDTITIVFHNLKTIVSQISASIGSLPVTFTEKKNDTIRFVVPEELATETNTVIVKINNLTLTLPNPVVLESPIINSINPMEGTAFVATGAEWNSNVLNDFWKYDTGNDSWTLATRIPGPRYAAVAFTVNNKAYVGYGAEGYVQKYDFYEFDPNYTWQYIEIQEYDR